MNTVRLNTTGRRLFSSTKSHRASVESAAGVSFAAEHDVIVVVRCSKMMPLLILCFRAQVQLAPPVH